MTDFATSDPTLQSLRAHFAAGNIDGARRAVLQLSPQARAELESRIGALAVSRMMQASRGLRGRVDGRVVVIHGIMGGKLATIDATGDEDLVWVNLLRLAAGRIGDFELDINGDPVDATKRVVTRGLMDEYMPLVLELGKRWDVLPVAFDWRLDIEKSADALDDAIRAWAGTDFAHIVAHSMGGLVSRRFMQKHANTWQSMKDPNGMHRGGRLIMLGTPNRGSFAIPFVCTGQETTVRWLELLDLPHNMDKLLRIINSFTGSYQMMPSPKLDDFGDDRVKLYTQATWGRFPVFQANLDRGRKFQEALHAVDDPDRLLYVAGFDQQTPYRIRVDGPGQFSYQQTLDGDGRVPHELGLLPGVKTFWVREKHGSLPSNPQVLAGIHELLSSGTTTALDAQKPSARAVPPAPVWRKASEIVPPPAVGGLPAARGRAKRSVPVDPQRRAQIEADMLEPFVSVRTAARPPHLEAVAEPRAVAKKAVRRAPAIRVEVVWGDISKVDGDVFVAGHYQGVEPQNAELALDKVVSGIAQEQRNIDPDSLVITSHTRRGILRGAVGDINFFPWANARKTVAIAGMGYPGTFGRPELQRLARSLAESVSTLPDVRTLNMVLIGSGLGNLPAPVALSALVGGLDEALRNGAHSSTLRRVRIVERDYRQSRVIARALDALKRSPHQEQLAHLGIATDIAAEGGGDIGNDIALSAVLVATARRVSAAEGAALRGILTQALHGIPVQSDLYRRCRDALTRLGADQAKRKVRGSVLDEHARSQAAKARRDATRNVVDEILTLAEEMNFGPLPDMQQQQHVPTRVSFIRDPGGVRVAAISDLAVVAERLSPLDWSLVDELIDRLTDPEQPADIPDFAGLLARLLIPRDFRPMLSQSRDLVLEVDRDTARVQWEMVGQFTDSGPATGALDPVGLQIPVARQLRTSYSPPPSRAPAADATLRALVIGDPGDPDKGLSLEGARSEALKVAQLLASHGVLVDLLVGAANVPREGELANVPPATVVEVLRLLGRNSYDIMHYCGHGDFDASDPEKRAGWLFGDKFFTSRELASVDQVPALVVANACLSGLLSGKREGADASRLRPTDDRLLPGLADEFFKRGVRNYIGTAWSVSDVGAVLFSTTLYEALLGANAPLGDALFQARTRLKEQERAFGALWAAYQHYGDPSFLVRPAQDNAAGAATAAARKTAQRRRKKTATKAAGRKASPRATKARRRRKS